jgi:uncharacterized protein
MNPVFVDTSYYVALFSRADSFHAEAVRMSENFERDRVVTEFVLLELGNIASRGSGRRFFCDLLRHLRNDPATTIVPASSELFLRGSELFANRPDKEWSLTDCTSFVVMKERGLNDALTTDHHFEQAGFTVLLR